MLSTDRLFFLLMLILLLFVGCDNTKNKQLVRKIEAGQNEIRVLRSENSLLKVQYQRLQDDCISLQSEYGNLKVKEADLARWSKQLAERFGPGVWYFGKNEKPLPYKRMENATPRRLVLELNKLFKASNLPEVALKKIEKDTAYVKISDDRKLTQEMGTTGATGYIQAVTYTLVSFPGIDYVDFDFRAGDHAVPGKYSR